MEELVLTTPKVESKTTRKYKVAAFTMDLEAIVDVTGAPGLVAITLRSDINEILNYSYIGATATTMIKQLNTANLTTKSMHKRILERLATDGIIPGAVQGAPDA